MPLQWKHGVLTTGLPGKCQIQSFLPYLIQSLIEIYTHIHMNKKKEASRHNKEKDVTS